MAGAAPPVMLMICWLICGPSVKSENGIETEMPGCKIKFELSNRKKTSRKTTSTSPRKTSHPKLYSFVRLSFMRVPQPFVDRPSCRSRIDTRLGSGCLLRLLEADDTADRPILRKHVDDLNSGALHVMHHGIHTRREIAVSDESRRSDD